MLYVSTLIIVNFLFVPALSFSLVFMFANKELQKKRQLIIVEIGRKVHNEVYVEIDQ